MWKNFIGLIIRIFCSIVTNFGKLRTLNESDGDSENELLDITTDEYEGQGSTHYLVRGPNLTLVRASLIKPSYGVL